MIFPKKYIPFLMPVCMSFVIGSCLSLVFLVMRVGFAENFLMLWAKSFASTYCIALPIALITAPLIKKFVDKITY